MHTYSLPCLFRQCSIWYWCLHSVRKRRHGNINTARCVWAISENCKGRKNAVKYRPIKTRGGSGMEKTSASPNTRSLRFRASLAASFLKSSNCLYNCTSVRQFTVQVQLSVPLYSLVRRRECGPSTTSRSTANGEAACSSYQASASVSSPRWAPCTRATWSLLPPALSVLPHSFREGSRRCFCAAACLHTHTPSHTQKKHSAHNSATYTTGTYTQKEDVNTVSPSHT